MILLLVLLVLTGCRSLEPIADEAKYNAIMVDMIPSMPVFPVWPAVLWTYQNGMYCLSESDVDIILDFGENILPQFHWELDQYERQLKVVIEELRHGF